MKLAPSSYVSGFLPWVLLSVQLNFVAVQADPNVGTMYVWSAWKSCHAQQEALFDICLPLFLMSIKTARKLQQ